MSVHAHVRLRYRSRSTTPNLGLPMSAKHAHVRLRFPVTKKAPVSERLFRVGDENPRAMSAFQVLFDLRKLFSTSFRFMKTLYIYRRFPPASRGSERVGCRPRPRGGLSSSGRAVVRARVRLLSPAFACFRLIQISPRLQRAPAFSFFSSFLIGSKAIVRGWDTPTPSAGYACGAGRGRCRLAGCGLT